MSLLQCLIPLTEPVQPLLRASAWFSVCAPRGPGSKWREQGGNIRATDYARGHFLSVLLFPGDSQALGVGVDLSQHPLCSQYPC